MLRLCVGSVCLKLVAQTMPKMATASRAAIRATSLLTPEAMPDSWSGAALIAVLVSGGC
jgi:hypothetical protein